MQQNIYVDTIFEGSNYIISQITGDNVLKGDVKSENSDFLSDDISVMVGINGGLNGHVTFSMSYPLAFKIASTLIGEDAGNILDELTKSCLSELGNMIMGHTSGIFSKNGIETDITPPAVITGEKVYINNAKADIAFCFPILFEDGHIMKINTALVNKVS